MIEVKRMDHLNMGVRNIAETEEFYSDLFGFEEKERGMGKDGEPFAIIGSADRVYLCIYEYGDLALPDDHLFIHHFGLYVDDFDLALKELQERKIELNYGGVIQQGKSRSAYIYDPNGYEIDRTTPYLTSTHARVRARHGVYGAPTGMREVVLVWRVGRQPVGEPLPLENRAVLARALRGGISVQPALALAAVLPAAVVASVRGCALALSPAAVDASALHLSALGLAGATQPAG